jgi:hypothetical protein
MERKEQGYVTLLIVILIAFGFLLSGGVRPLLQQTTTSTTTGRYVLVDSPLFPTHQTLQLSTLNFLYSAPVAICIPGTDFGDEPNILYAFSPSCNETVSTADGKIKVWYTDEHALTLGKNPGVSVLTASQTLANPQVGDKTAKDSKGYYYYPGLYLTDVTDNPTNTAGDAQNGGTGIPPSLIYGTWKALGEDDPSENDTLPSGADQLSSVASQYINTNTGSRGTETGFQAELIWNVSTLPVTPGRAYRAQFVIHDGDREGDIGLGCTTILLTTN